MSKSPFNSPPALPFKWQKSPHAIVAWEFHPSESSDQCLYICECEAFLTAATWEKAGEQVDEHLSEVAHVQT